MIDDIPNRPVYFYQKDIIVQEHVGIVRIFTPFLYDEGVNFQRKSMRKNLNGLMGLFGTLIKASCIPALCVSFLPVPIVEIL